MRFGLEYARAEGVNVDELLGRFGILPDVESRPEVEVELEKCNALMDAIASVLGDPFLGIHVAVRYQRGAYQLVEFACRNSPDVRGAIQLLVRHAALVNPAVAFSFTETGSTGALSHRFEGLGRHANEFSVAMLYLLARQSTREAWTPAAVWFAHEAPAEIAELASLFGTDRIRFGEESNGLLIGREVLDAPFTGADPALLRVLEAEMARQAPRPAASTSRQIVADTERAVRMTLELGAPRIEKVAQSLGTSVRTLQRLLHDEGSSFQDVVEQTRERLARQHAQRGEFSSTQMASLLGYADVTAFLRAFKRWTGASPQEFRGGKRAASTAKKKLRSLR
jgi:AraC-like DNA-binding protein